MELNLNNNENPVIRDDSIYGSKILNKPAPSAQIGTDLDDTFINALAYSGESSQIDISKLESFRQVSQARDQMYDLIDTMSEDSTIAAVLETYAEDATETNESGDILWVESDDPEVSKYINYLLDGMEVNKHIYKWVYSLCKYGDLYLRLYKQSEFEEFADIFDYKNKKEKLNEDVVVKAFSKSDKYAHYIEMVPNPAEMYELTKFGKSYAYIKAPVTVGLNRRIDNTAIYPSTFRYAYRMNDVQVYEPVMFAHACLSEQDSRYTEEVSLFLDNNADLAGNPDFNFGVKRGQSILYNSFKIWRELNLLQNALLLNRITKSSIVRIIGVEVGDMPKENVPKHLMGIKQLIEQKSAIDTGTSMSNYTNPGPMENNIYIPTRNGQGTITTQQVGGDVDVKGISDIEYFRDLLFGNLKIPKQFFGFTEDGAGFNGGQSLTILSSRYAKTIKRIQNCMIQAMTDVINLMLVDKGFDSYIRKYTLKMQPPTTQEEMDRRDNMSNKIAVATDIMNLLAEVEDASAKLRILKALLSNIVYDQDIINIIQEQIDLLEEQENAGIDTTEFNNGGTNPMLGGMGTGRMEPSGNSPDINDMDFGDESGGEANTESEAESETVSSLPNPSDLGGDFTDANMEI